MRPFGNPAVAEIFNAYPGGIRTKLMVLRELIFDVASRTEGVGELEESLRWGEPAYLTAKSKSGSTIRIDRKKPSETQYAIYFHCQTTLVDTFRTEFPTEFEYDGNRSIVFDARDAIPLKELSICIAMALTYHHRKRTAGMT
jgi:hypothetical protein